MRTATPPATPRARRAADLARLRRRNFAAFLGVLVVLTPLLVLSAWVFATVEHSENTDRIVEVRPGWTPQQVGDELQAEGVIFSSQEFQTLARAANVTGFPAGRYVLGVGISAQSALDALRGGPTAEIPDIPLLLPPGLSIDAVAERVGKLAGKSKERFLQVAVSGVVRSRYQPEGVDRLEGLTWPDTYLVGANQTEDQILKRIVDEFDRRMDEMNLVGEAANVGLSPYEVLIVASLVQTESGSDEDSPLIAAVILNRLREGMLLQIDATLCYAKGGCPPVPVEADKRIDSPYNTYRITGLPPTPIATLSASAIRAVLHPADVAYRYYVSDKHGKTYFAVTQEEHDRNVVKARNAE